MENILNIMETAFNNTIYDNDGLPSGTNLNLTIETEKIQTWFRNHGLDIAHIDTAIFSHGEEPFTTESELISFVRGL